MATLWVIIGILFFIGEIYTPGFYLACIGVSSLVAAIPAAFDTTLTVQLVVFGIALVITMILLRPVLNRFLGAKKGKTNKDRLIGRVVKVEKDIIKGEKGRVKVDGESWFAVCDEDVHVGESVRIVSIDGTVMKVEKI